MARKAKNSRIATAQKQRPLKSTKSAPNLEVAAPKLQHALRILAFGEAQACFKKCVQ
jgi:hypothetical protein